VATRSAIELVRLKVDLIVAASTPLARAVQQATATIPIVAPTLGDPVGDGFVAGLAHPGGNMTGSTFLGPGLVPKRLGLLKEAIPGVSRVAAYSARRHRVGLAAKHRLPTMFNAREFVELGGFAAYGASIPELNRRAGVYVDKILRGAKPGDLPIEQPTKFELVINLKTTKTLGITISQALLLRADEVIR
jgi:putative ABC transport system substrate-binding protein